MSLAFILKTPQQLNDYLRKIRAFQLLAVRGRIRCVECGETRWDVLHADHKTGNGARHRRTIGLGGKGAGMRTYQWIVRHPKTAQKIFQLLCANCHQLKTTYGLVPCSASDEEFDEMNEVHPEEADEHSTAS
jgi:hypothetical protein